LTLTIDEMVNRLHGRVLSEDGSPIGRARLQIGDKLLWGKTIRSTDRDGSFDFGQIGAAEVLLTIATSWSERIRVPAHGEEVVIRLPTPRTLRVRVVDSAGKPVPGARVTPWHDKTGREINGGELTGEDGCVILDGLPAKDLRLVTDLGVSSTKTLLR